MEPGEQKGGLRLSPSAISRGLAHRPRHPARRVPSLERRNLAQPARSPAIAYIVNLDKDKNFLKRSVAPVDIRGLRYTVSQ